MLAGAGKSLIDRSNGCTFVIGSGACSSVQPKSIWGMSVHTEDGEEQPKYFKQPVGNVEEEIGEMLFCERCVAAFAYARARGIDVPPNLDLEIHKDQLVDMYREWGLASGIRQASELVRDVERQGERLALEKGPRAPGGR